MTTDEKIEEAIKKHFTSMAYDEKYRNNIMGSFLKNPDELKESGEKRRIECLRYCEKMGYKWQSQ